MSTKYANNPTANLFELLQVDTDLPEKKGAKTQAKKPTDSPLVETPAEKGQRRKALEAQKAAVAAAEKQRKDAEEAMAALAPQEGFQVQKGSQQKKPSEAKGKLLNREQFNEKPEGQTDKKPFRGPGPQRKFDERKPGEKGAHPYRENKGPRGQGESNRPPRHEGYDKHSGAKTTNKPPPKRRGEGPGNWGEPTSAAADQWEDVKPTATAPAGEVQGWGDEGETKVQTTSAAAGWGDEGEKKSEKSDKKDETEDKKDKKPSEPAWDDEGFGKMTVQDFQKTVAAERAAALAKLNVGVKTPGRQIENSVDLSKCSYRDTSDEKEKKLQEERKKQLVAEKKTRGQQRAGTTNVDLTDYLEVRTRGGRGGGRGGGGRGGDRPPRQDKPEGEQAPATDARPAPRGERGGRGGGRGGNRVPKNAFPELSPSTPAATAPKSTK